MKLSTLAFQYTPCIPVDAPIHQLTPRQSKQTNQPMMIHSRSKYKTHIHLHIFSLSLAKLYVKPTRGIMCGLCAESML